MDSASARASQAEQRDGPRGCHCKRSRCLKLYCDCFAQGVYCHDLCQCASCLNDPANAAAVYDARVAIMKRTPEAFTPKASGVEGMGGGVETHRMYCVVFYCALQHVQACTRVTQLLCVGAVSYQ